MKKSIAIFIVFSVVILFAAEVFAQPQRGMMRGKRFAQRSPARILRLLKAHQKELNITDDQLEKIKGLVFSLEEKMIQMKSKASLQRLELRKLIQDKEDLDYEKIKAVLSKASEFRQEMFIDKLKLRKEIENILTPEQSEALKKMREERFRGRRFLQRGERFQRFQRFREQEKK